MLSKLKLKFDGELTWPKFIIYKYETVKTLKLKFIRKTRDLWMIE